MDFLDIYAMGSGIAQILSGFIFCVRFLHKRIKLRFYLLFVVCGEIFVYVIRDDGMVQMAGYIFLLTLGGILIPSDTGQAECPRARGKADWKPAVLSAVTGS